MDVTYMSVLRTENERMRDRRRILALLKSESVVIPGIRHCLGHECVIVRISRVVVQNIPKIAKV